MTPREKSTPRDWLLLLIVLILGGCVVSNLWSLWIENDLDRRVTELEKAR